MPATVTARIALAKPNILDVISCPLLDWRLSYPSSTLSFRRARFTITAENADNALLPAFPHRHEHRAHAIDLHALIGFDVGYEREHVGLLRRAGRVEQRLHHGQRAAVMLDHAFEKQPIELAAFAVLEALHLVGREHPGHQRGAVRVQLGAARDALAADLEPPLHHLDHVVLRQFDAQRELLHLVAGGTRLEQFHHLQRLRVMADHPLHELDVGAGVLDLRQVEYTGADIKFMQGMIGHHAQALEMVELLKTRTASDEMKKLALRIELSQDDETKS